MLVSELEQCFVPGLIDGTYQDIDMGWGQTLSRCIPGEMTHDNCQVNCHGSSSVTVECVDEEWEPPIDCIGRDYSK